MYLLFLSFVVACLASGEDVVALTSDSFDDFVKNDFVLVEFFAPWCGHCKQLAPAYDAAATALKNSGSPVKLATVDATVETDLAERFGIRGYPTLKFFRSGEPIDYDGGRTEQDIISWVTKKSGPPSKHLTTEEEVKAYVASRGSRALAFLDEEAVKTWVKVAKNDKLQAFGFAHVTDSALFGGKSAGQIELHKDGEDVKIFDGEYKKDSIKQWLLAEGFPLVDELSQESWTRAQTTKLDLLAVFYNKDDEGSFQAALEVAKAYKGDLIVTSSDQIGIGTRWGASGKVVPTAIYVHNKAEAPAFTVWDEEASAEVNAANLKAFVQGARDGSYNSYRKSEPVPESQGPVTVIVGKTFEEIVYSNKDVLVEFYAPWCGHCKKLAPVYDELGEAFKGDDGVVIAKIDATANGYPKEVQIQGFPTIMFWDANNKRSDYDGERDLESMQAWVKSHRVSKATERDEL